MSYPGGKAGSGVYQRIISQQPPHEAYIEPFLGGGAVMRRKLPALINIGIDADVEVISGALADLAAGLWPTSTSAGGGGAAGYEFRQENALVWLRNRSWTGRELVYCDPPYLMETRRRRRQLYRCELSSADHVRLLDVVLKLPCMVQISGYWSELYASRLAAWRTVSFQAQTRGGTTATEWLWMNYPEPVELHDYRYLGSGFRERERLKRLRSRWLARLARMGRLERGALLSAMRSTWPQRRG